MAQCEIKFKKIEEQKPKHERRKLPEKPPELDGPLPEEDAAIDDFNDKMAAIYKKTVLVSCEYCGRTFWCVR